MPLWSCGQGQAGDHTGLEPRLPASTSPTCWPGAPGPSLCKPFSKLPWPEHQLNSAPCTQASRTRPQPQPPVCLLLTHGTQSASPQSPVLLTRKEQRARPKVTSQGSGRAKPSLTPVGPRGVYCSGALWAGEVPCLATSPRELRTYLLESSIISQQACGGVGRLTGAITLKDEMTFLK